MEQYDIARDAWTVCLVVCLVHLLPTATSCNTLPTATSCTCTAYRNKLQHTATHLLPTATHCNTLQHIATYCNTLQHMAKYCSTQYMWQHDVLVTVGRWCVVLSSQWRFVLSSLWCSMMLYIHVTVMFCVIDCLCNWLFVLMSRLFVLWSRRCFALSSHALCNRWCV